MMKISERKILSHVSKNIDLSSTRFADMLELLKLRLVRDPRETT